MSRNTYLWKQGDMWCGFWESVALGISVEKDRMKGLTWWRCVFVLIYWTNGLGTGGIGVGCVAYVWC